MSQPSNPKTNLPTDQKTNPAPANTNGQPTNQPNQGAQPGKPANQPPANPLPAGNTTNQPKPQGTQPATLPGQPTGQPQAAGNNNPNQPTQGANPKPPQQAPGQTQPQPATGSLPQTKPNPTGAPTQPGANPQPNAGPQTGAKPSAPGQPIIANPANPTKPPGQNAAPGKADPSKTPAAKPKPTTGKGGKNSLNKTAHSDGEASDGEEIDLVKIGGKSVHIKQVYQHREEQLVKELETKRKKLAGAQTKLKELVDEHRKIAEQPRYVFPDKSSQSQNPQKPGTSNNPAGQPKPGQAAIPPQNSTGANNNTNTGAKPNASLPAPTNKPADPKPASQPTNSKVNDPNGSKLPPINGAGSKPSTAKGLGKSESEAKLMKIYTLERALKDKIKSYHTDIQKLEERLSRVDDAQKVLREKERILEHNHITDKTIHMSRLINQQNRKLFDEQNPRKFRRVKNNHSAILAAVLSPDKLARLKSPRVPPLKFPLDADAKLKQSQLVASLLAPKKNNNHLAAKTVVFDPKDPSKNLLTPKKPEQSLKMTGGLDVSQLIGATAVKGGDGKPADKPQDKGPAQQPNPAASGLGAGKDDKGAAKPGLGTSDLAGKPGQPQPATQVGGTNDKAPGKSDQGAKPGQVQPTTGTGGDNATGKSGLGGSELAAKPGQPQPAVQTGGTSVKPGLGGSELAGKPAPQQPANQLAAGSINDPKASTLGQSNPTANPAKPGQPQPATNTTNPTTNPAKPGNQPTQPTTIAQPPAEGKKPAAPADKKP